MKVIILFLFLLVVCLIYQNNRWEKMAIIGGDSIMECTIGLDSALHKKTLEEKDVEIKATADYIASNSAKFMLLK